jgi:hypothetical protein
MKKRKVCVGYTWNINYSDFTPREVFSTEAELIAKIRSLGDEEFNNASDEFLLMESYRLGEYEVNEVDVDDLEYISDNNNMEEEIWEHKDNGICYIVPIEIVRDFENMRIK